MQDALRSALGRAEEEVLRAEEAEAREGEDLARLDDPGKLQQEADAADRASRTLSEKTADRRHEFDAAQAEVVRQWPDAQRKAAELRDAELSAAAAAARAARADESAARLVEALEAAKAEQDAAAAEKAKAEERRAALAERVAESQAPAASARAAEEAVWLAETAQLDAEDALRRAKERVSVAQHRRSQQALRTKAWSDAVAAARKQRDGAAAAAAKNGAKLRQADAVARHGPATGADGQPTDEAVRENELVAQEIIIREQRDELDKRENMLRQSAGEFAASSAGRHDCSGSPTTA